jgi:hypothetical protein
MFLGSTALPVRRADNLTARFCTSIADIPIRVLRWSLVTATKKELQNPLLQATHQEAYPSRYLYIFKKEKVKLSL